MGSKGEWILFDYSILPLSSPTSFGTCGNAEFSDVGGELAKFGGK